jgi:predicted phosphodiesterase
MAALGAHHVAVNRPRATRDWAGPAREDPNDHRGGCDGRDRRKEPPWSAAPAVVFPCLLDDRSNGVHRINLTSTILVRQGVATGLVLTLALLTARRAVSAPSATCGLHYAGEWSMKVLALYDIHGNPDALEAVLSDPRAQGADIVVVGGDVVPGALAQQTLDRLDRLAAVVRVRGNGEREVAAAAAAASGSSQLGSGAGQTALVTAARLGVDRARALGDLPLTQAIDGVLFCHASPRRDDEMLTRLSAPDRWSEALAGVEAALVVGGHTHQQDDRTVNGVRFVNAGSVGLPYEGDGHARWLWIKDGVPELRSTAYDHVAAGVRMRESGYPDPDSIEAALIDPVEAIVVTRLFEQTAIS